MLDRMFLQQSGEKISIADVFSTSLYTGNGGSQNVTNGIKLNSKGGLVWLKQRGSGGNNPSHWLFDSARGSAYSLSTDEAGGQFGTWSPGVTFNSNGFNTGGHIQWNTNGVTYASWTFRKAPNFFDVVSYTGNGVSGRQIAHNLGSTPGCIIIKPTSVGGVPSGWSQPADWWVYHRGLPSPSNFSLRLNTSASQNNSGGLVATSTTFTVYGSSTASAIADNVNGVQYIAYLFAHDTASTGLVQCGSYSAQVGSEVPVYLGWQPQFVIIKKATLSESAVNENWMMFDTVRGITMAADQILKANNTDTETAADHLDLTATGFTVSATSFYATNYPEGAQYNYIAIRGAT